MDDTAALDTECNCGEYHDTKCPVAKALRNCWCTPEWLAKLIGPVDLDPCSNERSHIEAFYRLVSDNREIDDGLARPGKYLYGGWLARVLNHDKVFINPPYANGQVIRWVRQYCHTRFIYLLRWDPSTEWFSELIPHCTHVWFPPSRVDFEPPPRIKESSNPYPHALYLRDPPADLTDRLSRAGFLFDVNDAIRQSALDVGRKSGGSENGGRGNKAGSGGDDRGGTKGARDDREGDGRGPEWTNPDPDATKAHFRKLG